MKSAYELAMERLNKVSPAAKLTAKQRARLAELDSIYAAKTAGREIHLKEELAKAMSAGDFTTMEELQERLARERKALQAELEEKKDEVRQTGKA